MLQVKNQTPFVPGLSVLPDPTGVDTLYIAVKATFEIGAGGIRIAETQLPLVPADESRGKPGASSLRHAGEIHPLKPATDVVLVGCAYAPGGKPVPQFGAAFSVGRLRKVVAVFGDRTWKSGIFGLTPSSPVPVTRVPLVWERAYGGRHDLGEGRFAAEMRNPVGVGFRGKRSASKMKGTPLPNLEDRSHLIMGVTGHPQPAGVGFVAPGWQPRASFAGTYDARWVERRAPYFPADFDPRFFLVAPPDQVYPGYLRGGEPVLIQNAAPVGVQRFALPTCRLEVAARIAGKVERPGLRIETLLLEPDQGRFSLLWRGAAPCDKRALRVEEVEIGLKALRGVKE
jgi:hypothetical protein